MSFLRIGRLGADAFSFDPIDESEQFFGEFAQFLSPRLPIRRCALGAISSVSFDEIGDEGVDVGVVALVYFGICRCGRL